MASLKCGRYGKLPLRWGRKQNISLSGIAILGLADKIEGAVLPSDRPGVFNFTRYEPLRRGGYDNSMEFSLLLLAWKLAQALAAGNTAVVKPSEFTSASSLEFMELIKEAGIPDGVVNCITGTGVEVGQPMVDHPDVAKVAFTDLMSQARKFMRVQPEKLCQLRSSLAVNLQISCSRMRILRLR